MAQPSIEYYNGALDALQAGNAPEALAAIVNSLTEDPNDTQTWQLYIVILNALGRTEDAQRATAKLKEKGLSPVDELLMKAAEASTGGDPRNALPHLEAALALDSGRAEIHISYALALSQTGDQNGGLAAAERAVQLDPEDPHGHYAIGHILRLQKHNDAALESLTRAVALDPRLMIAVYEQGMLLAEAGRLREALVNFEKYAKAHPEDPSASQAIAAVKQRISNPS